MMSWRANLFIANFYDPSQILLLVIFFLDCVRSNTQHTKHISIGIGECERGGCVAMVMIMMMTKMSNNTKCRTACFCEISVLFYINMRGMV